MNKTKTIPSMEELSSAYGELGNYRDVAKRFGCCVGTVYNWMKYYNIDAVPHKGRKLSDESKKKVVKTLNPYAMKGKFHSGETRRKMSECKKGADNPNYKGGKTLIIRKVRRTKEYAHWRKSVLERANGKCEMCGNELPLEAHHIRSIHKDMTAIHDLDNGMALCRECHLAADGKAVRTYA